MSSTNSPLPGAENVRLPDTAGSRIFSLDVLGGIALLGILMISIWEFGGFTGNEQSFYISGPHGGNFRLMAAVSILFEGKMLSLLAMVFGAGMLLFLRKKEFPVVISPADAYIRRQLWLIGFGLINAFILLWPGDILFQFGVVGILLFAFTRMKTKGFFILALICTLIYSGKLYWNYSDDKQDLKKFKAVELVEKKFKADSLARATKDSLARPTDSTMLKAYLANIKLTDSLARKNDTLTNKQKEEKGKWEGIIKGLRYDSSTTMAENKAMRQGWGTIWNHLVKRSQAKESSWLYRIGLWDIASMMFLGMALFSMGFFTARFSTSKYLLMGSILLLAGFALAWYRIKLNDARVVDYANYISKRAVPYDLFFPFERAFMVFGYAAWIMGLLRTSFLQWCWQALAKMGQMALSNYILQTLICTFFFYGFAFGYFGRLKQWGLYFFVAEVALAQIVFSVLWLRYYRLGPIEWLLQTLIYRKKLPNKKTDAVTPAES